MRVCTIYTCVCIWHSMYALHVYMYVYYYGLFYELLLLIEYVCILCIVSILRVYIQYSRVVYLASEFPPNK